LATVTASENPTEAIASYITTLGFDDLPAAAVENAKLAVLDTIGVTLAGSQTETALQVQAFIAGSGAAGASTLLGSALRTSPELAALGNGVAAHVLDFDDRWHSSTHTLPAALALAELHDLTGRDLLIAYVIGREVRLHFDAEFRAGRGGEVDSEGRRGPGWRGWHETGVFGSLGAVAAASKILSLDVHQTQMALGIAASLASGLMANFGTSTKSLHAGNAARNGVLAASLASSGFTADPDILGARRGLIEAITYPEDRSAASIAKSLQENLLIVEKGVRIKPYPSCTGTHQFIEMMRLLIREHEIKPDDIEKMTISRIEGATTKREFPTTELECRFSPAFVAVATLIDGKLTLQNCTLKFLQRPDVQDLLSRTQYVDAEVGFIDVHTSDGRTLSQSTIATRHQGGSPAFDLEDEDEISAKFHDCSDPVIGEVRSRRLEAMLWDLEDVGSIRELTELMTIGG